MTIKEIEEKLKEYLEQNTNYNYRKNAIEELGKVREKFTLDDVSHIAFIVGDYPKYDHFLLKLEDNNFFLRLGLSKEYLKSLSKKDLRQVAKAIHSMFGQFKLKKEKE